jgi:hypothetical protein
MTVIYALMLTHTELERTIVRVMTLKKKKKKKKEEERMMNDEKVKKNKIKGHGEKR